MALDMSRVWIYKQDSGHSAMNNDMTKKWWSRIVIYEICSIFSSNTLLFEHLFRVWNPQCKEGVVVVWDMSEYGMQDIGYGW